MGVKNDISPLHPKGKGRSYALIWRMLKDIRTLKYCTPKHLKTLDKKYSQICAKWKLQKLCELGYLKNTYNDVYIATDKILQVIDEPKLLSAEPEGKGDSNELNNTDVFVKLMKRSDFLALLFPRFPKEKPRVWPDGLLVIGEPKKYKLVFLEIEKPKTRWLEHLEKKRDNYNWLSGNIKVYSYWKYYAPLLGLPVPEIDNFFFYIWCLGEFKADWKGWKFVKWDEQSI